jgi:ribosome-binding protein aMBF1 (putative translation factor)
MCLLAPPRGACGPGGRLSRPWKELRQELFRDPEFRKADEELEPAFQIAEAIIALRASKGLTQEQMAERAAIKRPMLGRIEGRQASACAS